MNVPGPAKYDYLKPLGSDAIKCSIDPLGNRHKRTKEFVIPGPGEYDHFGINSSGKYPPSSLRNTHNVVWGNSKTKRFDNGKNI